MKLYTLGDVNGVTNGKRLDSADVVLFFTLYATLPPQFRGVQGRQKCEKELSSETGKGMTKAFAAHSL